MLWYLFISVSVCVCLCPSVPLYVCLSVSVCVCLCPSVPLYVCLSLSVCISLSVCLSVSVCLYMSVCISLCICLSFSMYLYVCLYISVCMSLFISVMSTGLRLNVCLHVSLYICVSLCVVGACSRAMADEPLQTSAPLEAADCFMWNTLMQYITVFMSWVVAKDHRCKSSPCLPFSPLPSFRFLSFPSHCSLSAFLPSFSCSLFSVPSLAVPFPSCTPLLSPLSYKLCSLIPATGSARMLWARTPRSATEPQPKSNLAYFPS